MNSSQQISISLSIKEVKCLSFSLTEYAMKNKNPIKDDGYEFVYSGGFEIVENEKIIKINGELKIFEKKDETLKFELANLRSRSVVFIQNFDEVIKKTEPNHLFVPDNLIALCQNIAVSSLRGMVSIKLDDTLYSNAVFPFIDMKLLAPKVSTAQ